MNSSHQKGATPPRPRLRIDVPPRAAAQPLLNQGDDTLGGGEQATMEAPIYDVASSCLVCGVEFFDVGHRTSRRGVELFDVASNFSTWHRTFRRGVEMFDVGHRNVAGERPLTSNIPTFPHRRIRQRSHSCCATVLLGRYRKTLSGLASLFRWGALRISAGYSTAYSQWWQLFGAPTKGAPTKGARSHGAPTKGALFMLCPLRNCANERCTFLTDGLMRVRRRI